MPRLLMTLAVYDAERDLIQVPLSDFAPENVMRFAWHFQKDYERWNPLGLDIPATMETRASFIVDGITYLVVCKFHTWDSITELLLGNSPL